MAEAKSSSPWAPAADETPWRDGNTWTAKRTTPASKRMFEAFPTRWVQDADLRYITRKVVNRFIVHLQIKFKRLSASRVGRNLWRGRQSP